MLRFTDEGVLDFSRADFEMADISFIETSSVVDGNDLSMNVSIDTSEVGKSRRYLNLFFNVINLVQTHVIQVLVQIHKIV